jgi:membrane-bound lytic murein transglycosylase D
VADIVEAPVEEIVALNPSLLRMMTPPEGSYTLHLPPGTGQLFAKRIAEIPDDKRNSWRFHKLQSGDTVESVARSYHVSASDLAATNQIEVRSELNGLEALVVPVALAAEPIRSTTYLSRKGDSLVTIADRFGVTVEQLKRWNKLATTKITPGRRVYVSEPAHVHPALTVHPRSRHGSKTTASASQEKGATKHSRAAVGKSAKSAGKAAPAKAKAKKKK